MLQIRPIGDDYIICWFKNTCREWRYLITYRPSGQCRAIWSFDESKAKKYSEDEAVQLYNILRWERRYNYE